MAVWMLSLLDQVVDGALPQTQHCRIGMGCLAWPYNHVSIGSCVVPTESRKVEAWAACCCNEYTGLAQETREPEALQSQVDALLLLYS